MGVSTQLHGPHSWARKLANELGNWGKWWENVGDNRTNSLGIPFNERHVWPLYFSLINYTLAICQFVRIFALNGSKLEIMIRKIIS